MKVTKLAALLALSLSLPIAIHSAAMAQDPGVTGTDTQAHIDMAKERLDKARVRLEIAKKQVDAAKARLKAAEAEFKASAANHAAKSLEHSAKKLSDASGLPEITEGQIEQNRARAVALKEAPNPKADAPAQPVDLSQTRLKQVDFNAQPMEGENHQQAQPAAPTPDAAPASQELAPGPDKQANVDPAYRGVPAQVAATTPPSLSEQPPIVP